MVVINAIFATWLNAIGGPDTIYFFFSFGVLLTFIYIFYKITT